MDKEIIIVRENASGTWFWVNKSIIKEHGNIIGPYGIAVYNALCLYANVKGSCFPSVKTICKKINVSKSKVHKSLKQLEERQLIKIIRNQEHGKVNTYYLLKTEKEGVSDAHTPYPCDTQVGVSVEHTNKNKAEQEITNKNKKEKQEEDIYMDLIELLHNGITTNKQDYDFRPGYQQKWKKAIDEMTSTKPKRKPEVIKKVILFSQEHYWWKNRIHSMGAIRKNFDELEMQMNEKKPESRKKNILTTGVVSGLDEEKMKEDQRKLIKDLRRKKYGEKYLTNSNKICCNG